MHWYAQTSDWWEYARIANNVFPCFAHRQLVTSYNRGYAFSPTKSRLARFEPSPDSITEPLISVNNENVTHRLSDCVNQDEAKSAFRILQTAGMSPRSHSVKHMTPRGSRQCSGDNHLTLLLSISVSLDVMIQHSRCIAKLIQLAWVHVTLGMTWTSRHWILLCHAIALNFPTP